MNLWRPSLSSTPGWIRSRSRRGITPDNGSRRVGGTTPRRTRFCSWRRSRREPVSRERLVTSCSRSSSIRRPVSRLSRPAPRATGCGRAATSARCTPRARARAAVSTSGRSSPAPRFPAPRCSSETWSRRARICPRTRRSRSTRTARTTAARCTRPPWSADSTRTGSPIPVHPCGR